MWARSLLGRCAEFASKAFCGPAGYSTLDVRPGLLRDVHGAAVGPPHRSEGGRGVAVTEATLLDFAGEEVEGLLAVEQGVPVGFPVGRV